MSVAGDQIALPRPARFRRKLKGGFRGLGPPPPRPRPVEAPLWGFRPPDGASRQPARRSRCESGTGRGSGVTGLLSQPSPNPLNAPGSRSHQPRAWGQGGQTASAELLNSLVKKFSNRPLLPNQFKNKKVTGKGSWRQRTEHPEPRHQPEVLFKKEGTRVCLWPIHTDVWQKPSQYCKLIILQLK